jgi:hypothetical protein
VEQELAAGLGEGQITELVEDQEVEPAQQVGHAALPVGAGLGIELVDQIDDIEEPAAGASADAGARVPNHLTMDMPSSASLVPARIEAFRGWSWRRHSNRRESPHAAACWS